MKKHIILCLIIFLLCACSFQRDYYKELSNYYLSLTSSTQINENHVSVENQVYDFQRRKMTIHDNYQLTAQYIHSQFMIIKKRLFCILQKIQTTMIKFIYMIIKLKKQHN